MKLTGKQEMFCREYIACDFNATEAARKTGYKNPNVVGPANLVKIGIQQRIDELKAERMARLRIDADYLLHRLHTEAEADLADLYDECGHLKPIQEWPKIWRQGLVAGIDVEKIFEQTGKKKTHIGDIVKVKLSDRAKRLEMLGKHISVGAFSEKHEHKHTGSIEHVQVTDSDKEMIRELRKRREEARVTH